MSYFGTPFGSPFGNNENFASQIKARDVGGGLLVDFTPQTGMDCWWRLILDSLPQGTPQKVLGGQAAELKGVYNAPGTKHEWAVFCQGGFSSPLIDPSIQLAVFAAGRATRLIAMLATTPKIFSYNDADQFSNWALTGAQRFQNVRPVQGLPTWGSLDLTLTTAGGVHTVTLALDGVVLASGARTGDGTVTLTDQGGGISGTVSLAYTADFAAGTLIHDWPAQLKVYYKTSPYGSAPSGAAQAVIQDDGFSSEFVFRSASLAPGTYYLIVHQVDSDGNESTGLQSGGVALTINALPASPGLAVYVSGGYAATVIQIATGAGAYNLYDSADTGVLDMTAATPVTLTGAAPGHITLPAIASSYTGPRYVLVRQTAGGVESANSDVAEIDYTAGVVNLAAPNIPGLSGKAIRRAGLQITVPVTVNLSAQAVPVTEVRLYLFLQGGSPSSLSGSTPSLTTVGHVAGGTVIATAPSAGLYCFVLRGYASSNGQESEDSQTYGPFEMTTAAPVDPAISAYAGM